MRGDTVAGVSLAVLRIKQTIMMFTKKLSDNPRLLEDVGRECFTLCHFFYGLSLAATVGVSSTPL
jgi:hypothetical protein